MGSAGSVTARNASALERSRMAAQMAGSAWGDTSRKSPPSKQLREKLREQLAELDPVLPITPPGPESEEEVPTLKLRTRRRLKFEVRLPGCPEDIDSEFLEEEAF